MKDDVKDAADDSASFHLRQGRDKADDGDGQKDGGHDDASGAEAAAAATRVNSTTAHQTSMTQPTKFSRGK